MTAQGVEMVAERLVDTQDRMLIERLYPPLQRFAAIVAPEGIEGDDLLQEALVRALKRRKLSDIAHPAAYLRKTMINLASNHRRQGGSQRRALTRWAASHRSDDLDAYPSDLSELMALPPEARAVLYLSEVEGYRFDEIADLVGCSESAARKRASRARRVLRIELAEEAGQ